MILRPDEAANEAEIERDQRFRSNVGQGIKTAAKVGIGIAGGALASKVLPFLNQYIPANLAMKGINAVSPELGSFLKKGQAMGLDLQKGFDFLKEKLSPQGQSQAAPSNKNIIEQYSPELHQFLNKEIQSGRSPLEAAGLARLENKKGKDFRQIIKKIEGDHKTNWSDIIQSIYGGGQKAQTQQPQQQQASQPQAAPAQSAAQPGSGQDRLIQAIQQFKQARGG